MPVLSHLLKHRLFFLVAPSLMVLISAYFLPSSDVNAGRMLWSPVDTPCNTFNVVVSPSEINSLAICQDGRTIYCIDTANSKVYRSDDAGASYYDLSGYLTAAGASLPAWFVATAPDNPRYVAAVTSSGGSPGCVFVSADAGQTWNDTGLPAAGSISSIAISPFYGNYDIAAGTRAAGAGSIFIYKAAGIGGSWADQGFSGDVLSLKFSPNYKSDPSLAILFATVSGSYFNVAVRDLNANTADWSAIYSGTPPEITTGGAGTSARANQVITGDLELPLDHSGHAPSQCRAYVCIDSIGGSAGVFRIDGTTVYQLMSSQANRRISSIAYKGTYVSGHLLVGEVQGDSASAAVLTWTTDAPMTCPSTCWYRTEKPPTGSGTSGYGNAQVAWSPDSSTAYCGTSSSPLNGPAAWPGAYLIGTPLDESAFNISRDNGQTWNQLSLIDTQISALSDVAVSPDSNTIYLATLNNTGVHLDSIWRSNSQTSGKSWERVLCVPSTTNDILLRVNNNANMQSTFFASRGTSDLKQSQDYGQTWHAQLPGIPVADFSVTSLNSTPYIFVLGNAYVRKGNVTSNIPQWSQQVATNLTSAHTIFAAPNGVIVVGGNSTDNRVACSIDGGISFNIVAPLPETGNIHAIIDYRLSNTFIIYAASDTAGSDIYAFIPGAASWNPMGAPSAGFWGLEQMGTLYGAASSSIDRTLQPEMLGPPAIEWNSLNQGLPAGVAFTREPLSLKISEGTNLWAIDNRAYNYAADIGRLWTYCDCLSPGTRYTPPSPPPREVLFAAPLPYAPKPDDLIPVYIGSNTIADITFQWDQSTPALEYEIWLAANGDFSQLILQKTITPQNPSSPSWTLTDKKGLAQGKTYYWKVRVVQAATREKGEGTWSEPLPFTIAQAESKSSSAVSVPQDNQTIPVSPPATQIQPSTGENKTSPFSNLISGNIHSWIWLVLAVLVCTLIAVVITRALASRRKI
ncbi:MAG: hypothetical protein JXA01_05500 [Dehalococcoidia bacterium]|nr:hypothetical protein [Dehalococcoidia bacterium]